MIRVQTFEGLDKMSPDRGIAELARRTKIEIDRLWELQRNFESEIATTISAIEADVEELEAEETGGYEGDLFFVNSAGATASVLVTSGNVHTSESLLYATDVNGVTLEFTVVSAKLYQGGTAYTGNIYVVDINGKTMMATVISGQISEASLV